MSQTVRDRSDSIEQASTTPQPRNGSRNKAMNHALGARTTSGKALTVVGIVTLLIFTLLPAYMMVSTAFDQNANDGSRGLFPTTLTWDNFSFVLNDGGFTTYLRNSFLVGIGTVVISGVLSLFAAVAVARFRFRFRTTILVLVLLVQMVPLEALVIPMFIQARDLGLLNQLFGLVVVYVAFSLSFAVWMLRGFVAAVPVEIEEAAYVDGASWFRMFRSVLLPLVAPGLVATSIFSFITAWNEFIFAITFIADDDRFTAAAGLRSFFGIHQNDWGAVMAGSSLITVPVMIFFIFVQRRLAEGLVSGAVKG